MLEDGIPGAGRQKPPAEPVPRKGAIDPQLVDEPGGQEKDTGGENQRDEMGDLVTTAQTLNECAGAARPGGTGWGRASNRYAWSGHITGFRKSGSSRWPRASWANAHKREARHRSGPRSASSAEIV